MDLTQLLAALRRRWRSAVVMLVIVVGLNAAATFLQQPVYQSRSQLAIPSASSTVPVYARLISGSYARMIGSTMVADGVIRKLGLGETPQELADQIQATVVEDGALINVVVKANDPAIARLINAEAIRRLGDHVDALDAPTDISQDRAVVNVTIAPTLERIPVSPRVRLNLLFALIIGVLVGVATAVVRELLDRTFRTADEVARTVGAPVLAMIGLDSSIPSTWVGENTDGFVPRFEAFSLLRTNLQFVEMDQQPRCLLITSAEPSAGKTTVATNLAIALAQTGRKTLVIDADLRRQCVAPTLGLDAAVGLTTVLIGRADLGEAIQVHGPSGLHVLASGAEPPNPTEILQLGITRDLIARLCHTYEMVIIDAPPLLPVADASVLSRIADGTILVVRSDQTATDQAAQAADRVRQGGGRLIGVVVNMVAKRTFDSSYYQMA